MAPKQKKQAKKIYDYSGLEKGMRVQAEADGTYYAAEVVQVSTSKNRSSAPVKVSYKGYEGYDEWVGGDRLRSKALKVEEPPKKEKPERKPAELVTEGEIPIKRVARVYQMKVGSEANALKMDELCNKAHAALVGARKDNAKGYLKCSRQVCKSEWAYEMSFVFDSHENFKAYDEGKWREEVIMPIAAPMKDLAVGEIYKGVRVYNELGAGRP